MARTTQAAVHLTRRRPAETAGAGAAIGGLLTYVFGLRDPEALAALVAAVGLVPGAVTYLMDNGGLLGIVSAVLHGRDR